MSGPRGSPAREALIAWAATTALLAGLQLLAALSPPLRALAAAASVGTFLWAASHGLSRRGQTPHDAGFRFDRLGADLLWAMVACAVFLPPFGLLFAAFVRGSLPLPAVLVRSLSPYGLGVAHPLRLGWPDSAAAWQAVTGLVLGNVAVALAEELFFRGYLTLRLEQAWPPRRRILGAPLGRAAVLTAALFALTHLVVPAPHRLFVFFPALVFAWLRARTGTVVGAAACHLVFNLTLALLERAAS